MTKLFDAYIASFCKEPSDFPEFYACICDLFESDEVQCLEQFEQHLDIDRLQHIVSVAYIAFLTSRRLGLDFKTTARGAILHDLFYYDWRENDWSHRPHGYRHPGFAVKNARELCGGLDKKTENIIKRHMWPLTPLPPRYAEGLVVCLADKYCATQELMISVSEKYRSRFDKLCATRDGKRRNSL